MNVIFSTRVYIGAQKKFSFKRIFFVILGIIIFLCFLIKILMGDFSFGDIAGFLLSLIIIGSCRVEKPMYAYTNGNIRFYNEYMEILYPDIDGGKKIGRYSELTTIKYENIESIEYGEELECYRIISKCEQTREYFQFGKKNVVQDGGGVAEIFMYVLDEVQNEKVMHLLKQYTNTEIEIVHQQ